MSSVANSTISTILSDVTYGLYPNAVGTVTIPVETAQARIARAKARLITEASEAGIASGASEVIDSVFDSVTRLVDLSQREVTVRFTDLESAVDSVRQQLVRVAEEALSAINEAPIFGWDTVEADDKGEVAEDYNGVPFGFDFGDYEDEDYAFVDSDDYGFGYSAPTVTVLAEDLDAIFEALFTPRKTEATVTLDGPGTVTLTADGKLLVSV